MADKKKFEEKSFKHDTLGTINMGTNGEFNISNADLYAFYEANGVPKAKEVLSAISAARGKLTEEAVSFMKDHVIERKDDCTFNAGIGTGRVEVTLYGETKNMNPQTKQEIVSYGKVKVKVIEKVPRELTAEGGTIAKIAAEIAASWK